MRSVSTVSSERVEVGSHHVTLRVYSSLPQPLPPPPPLGGMTFEQVSSFLCSHAGAINIAGVCTCTYFSREKPLLREKPLREVMLYTHMIHFQCEFSVILGHMLLNMQCVWAYWQGHMEYVHACLVSLQPTAFQSVKEDRHSTYVSQLCNGTNEVKCAHM